MTSPQYYSIHTIAYTAHDLACLWLFTLQCMYTTSQRQYLVYVLWFMHGACMHKCYQDDGRAWSCWPPTCIKVITLIQFVFLLSELPCFRHFFVYACRSWNSLPEYVVDLPSSHSFKAGLSHLPSFISWWFSLLCNYITSIRLTVPLLHIIITSFIIITS